MYENLHSINEAEHNFNSHLNLKPEFIAPYFFSNGSVFFSPNPNLFVNFSLLSKIAYHKVIYLHYPHTVAVYIYAFSEINL